MPEEVDNSICGLCNTKGKLVRTGKTVDGVVVSEYQCCDSNYMDYGEALAEILAAGEIEIWWDDKSYDK